MNALRAGGMFVVAAAIFTVPLAAAPPTPISPSQTAKIVTGVEAFFNAAATFECDVDEEWTIKAFNVKTSMTGHFVSAPGGKLDFTSSNGARVVSDGVTLDIFDATSQRLLVTPAPTSSSPLAFFLEAPSLSSFTFEAYSGADLNFPGGVVLIGTPVAVVVGALSKVILYVEQASNAVRRVLLLDAQGNRDRYDFRSTRINGPVSSSFGLISPTPKTTIVHQAVAPARMRP